MPHGPAQHERARPVPRRAGSLRIAAEMPAILAGGGQCALRRAGSLRIAADMPRLLMTTQRRWSAAETPALPCSRAWLLSRFSLRCHMSAVQQPKRMGLPLFRSQRQDASFAETDVGGALPHVPIWVPSPTSPIAPAIVPHAQAMDVPIVGDDIATQAKTSFLHWGMVHGACCATEKATAE